MVPSALATAVPFTGATVTCTELGTSTLRTWDTHVIEGRVNPKYIDWEYGFTSFMYYGEDQWEVSLLANTPVEIVAMNDEYLARPIEGNTGRAGESWERGCGHDPITRPNPPEARAPRFLGVGLNRVAYPKDLHRDPRFRGALEAARQTPYLLWDRWLQWYRTATDQDLADFADSARQAIKRRLEQESERAEEARWESQAFDVTTPRPRSGYRGRLDGALVWMYHGTSSELLPAILRDGLLPIPPRKRQRSATGGWVYLTPNRTGMCSAENYAHEAAYAFGGDAVILRVIVPWQDLAPDLDDRDISCGKHQWRTRSPVPPEAIFEVDGRRVRGEIGHDYIDAMHLWNNARPRTPGGWFGDERR